MSKTKGTKINEDSEAIEVDTLVIKPCPFCGKIPQEYQGRGIDGNGEEFWEAMVQCHTVECATSGRCFVKDKWNQRVL